MGKPIKCFLNTIIPEEHQWKIELFSLWNTIIGHMKNRVSIQKIDNHTLYLSVSHPAWAQELHLLAPFIKKKINAHFPEPKIHTIRFHNGSLSTIQKFSRKNQDINTLSSHESITLTPQENSILATLQSNPLQSVVAAYFIRCKTVKRGKDEKK